jgi:hypothetical protein
VYSIRTPRWTLKLRFSGQPKIRIIHQEERKELARNQIGKIVGRKKIFFL